MTQAPLMNAHFYGEGVPVLIIHGWTMDCRWEINDFEPVFENTTGYRRIYVDLPGHGTSPSNGITDQDSIYQRLVDFIEQVIGDTHFLLIGSSCGGYLARALAQQFATRIDGLLLRVPMIEADDSKRDVAAFEPVVGNETIVNDLSPTDRRILKNLLVQTPEYTDALRTKLNTVVVPAVKAADHAVLYPIRHDPKRYQLSHFSEETPNKVTAPTLILTGRHDTFVGWRDSLRLADLYPRATYVVLDRGIHNMPIDETGLFQSLMGDWLYRVNEWRNTHGRTGDAISK